MAFLCYLVALLFSVQFLAVPASGQTTLYANNSCSNNGNGTSSSCAASSGGAGAYNTFANLVSGCTTAGDVCKVETGNYTSEAAQTISHSGTGSAGVCSSCITFEPDTGATVSISPLSLDANYIIIEGLTITDPTLQKGTNCVYLNDNTTGQQILNNTITQCGFGNSTSTANGYACIGSDSSSTISYVTIMGNAISWCSALSSLVNTSYVVPNSTTPGAGCSVGTVLNIVQSGGSGGTVTVETVSGGVPTFLVPGNSSSYGTGYTVANGVSTTTASGSCSTQPEVNITAVATGLAGSGQLTGGNAHISQCMDITGSNILILNNTCAHASAAILPGSGTASDAASTNWIVAGNTIGPAYTGYVDTTAQYGQPPQWDAIGCYVNNSCNTHWDSTYITGNSACGTSSCAPSNLVYENNIYQNIWGSGGGFVFFSGGGTPNSSDVIFRFNHLYKVDTAYGGYYSTLSYLKWYNNTAVSMSQQGDDSSGITICGHGGTNDSSGLSYVNDLHYNTNNPLGDNGAPWYTWFSECLSPVSGHNLLYDTSCSPSTLSNCTTGSSKTDTGNVWGNPLLTSTTTPPFNLQSGSPALNAGGALTTVASGDSGSGTSLIVNDATYFQAGLGIQGEGSLYFNDCIAVGTTGNHVCATAVNYSTNTITLASSISRSSGQSVWLYSGAQGTTLLPSGGPNIGAGFLSALNGALNGTSVLDLLQGILR